MTSRQLPAHDFAAAFERAFAELRTQIGKACTAQQEWPARVAIGVQAAFAFAISNQDAARLLTCEALARGEEGQFHYRGMISYFATLLLPGRDLYPVDGGRPAISESAMAAGVAQLVGRRLKRGQEEELPAAAADAVQFILIPYIGVDQARRVASEHC
jgi:hypothetical protein